MKPRLEKALLEDAGGPAQELLSHHEGSILIQPNEDWPRDVVEMLTSINKQIWDEQLSLAGLCRELRISRGSIAGRFARYVGESPKRYVLGRRVFAARDLIDQLDISAAEAAAWVGFRHASSLRKALSRSSKSNSGI